MRLIGPLAVQPTGDPCGSIHPERQTNTYSRLEIQTLPVAPKPNLSHESYVETIARNPPQKQENFLGNR